METKFFIKRHIFRNKLHKKVSKYKIFKIVFAISTVLIISISLKKNKNTFLTLIEKKDDFDDILPKIKLNDIKIPDKADVFKSRELFISDSKLTKNYIRYIKPNIFNYSNDIINKTFEDLEPDLSFTNDRKDQMNTNDFYDLCLKENIISNESFHHKTEVPLVSVLILVLFKLYFCNRI